MLGTCLQTVHFGFLKAINSPKPKSLCSNLKSFFIGSGADITIFEGAGAQGTGAGAQGAGGGGGGGGAGTHGAGGGGGGGGKAGIHGTTGAGLHNTCGAGTTACGTHEHALLMNGIFGLHKQGLESVCKTKTTI